MKQSRENEFIEKFAIRWNEKLTEFTTRSGEEKVYVGSLHLQRMLKYFLKAYKKMKKEE